MLISVAQIIGGFILLVWGADRLVAGASALARNLGVSPLVIGLTIIAFGTSAPELVVSGMAAYRGNPGLAVGNAIGSNIANIALVLGLTAAIRPMEVRSTILRREMPALLAVTLLTTMVFLDSFLGRLDGLMLIGGLVLVLHWLVRLGMRSHATDPLHEEIEAELKTFSVERPMALILPSLYSELEGPALPKIVEELKLATFDAGLAAAMGLAPTAIHYGLMTVVSITALPLLLAVIPTVGVFIGGIAWLTATILVLRHISYVSMNDAALAVLIALAVTVMLTLGVVFLINAAL